MSNLSLRAACALWAASPLALFVHSAVAQEPPPPAAAPPAAAPPAAPPPAPADPPPVAASVEVAVSTPAPPAPPAPPPPAARAAEPVLPSPLRLSLFADAYFGLQTSESGSVATLSGHRAYAGQGGATNGPGNTRLAENGFALAWLGLDASYDAGAFAVTGSLRFGQGAAIFHNDNDVAFGIDNITQGYLTWRPLQGLDLDLGMFGTPFGAEVAESWKNLNYTRGALYYYGQPFWHTGLRAKYAVSDKVSITGLLVNGTNNLSETQQGDPIPGIDQSPTIGAQVGFAPTNTLTFALGGLVATDGEENNDLGFDTFLDLVAVLNLGALSAVFNADYILTQNPLGGADDRGFFGVSGAVGYALSDMFGIAGRLEFLTDSFAGGAAGGDEAFDGSNATSWSLITATATLTYKPIPDTPNLIIRWDNRFEKSNQDVFGDAVDPLDPTDNTFKDNWFESVIGVVVTTSP